MSVMIEIDPKLFVTCRLCLQDMGQYQIVPKVQEQIKFCFDIEVEPFDGLPQLICKKCEGILSGFYDTKTAYITKQKDLKDQFSLKREIKLAQQESIDSGQQNGLEKQSLVFGKKRRRNKILRILSSSSEHSFEDNNNYDSDIESWTLSYNKEFACRFCKYKNSNQSDILKHVHMCQKQIKEKYRNVLKRTCLVQLQKLDAKPNITGLNSTVVLCDGKIIEYVNKDYFIVYSTKNGNHNVCESSDGGNDDIIKKKRKRFRLLSKSSNETVVVHPDEDEPSSSDSQEKKRRKQKADSKDENEVLECIKIDDSSDSGSDKGNVSDKKKSQMKLLQKHQETTQSIISLCKNNYLKNMDDSSVQAKQKKGTQSTNIESQLKHKLLSIGRKIVNKSGFNCTGLLRYMDHKNLDITWIPKSTVNFPTNTDYIRIMTKLKDNMEEDDTGWKTLPVNVVVKNSKTVCVPTTSSAVITNLAAVTNNEIAPIEKVLHNDVNYISHQNKNKLLNKNPVANPKQLPKKTHVMDTQSYNHPVMLTNIQNHSHNDSAASIEMTENTFMPIMTSVTSLAHNYENSYNNETADTNTTKTNTDSHIGKIKVKPVSELMSERVLNNIKERTPALNTQESMNALNFIPSPQTRAMPIQTPNTTKKNEPTSNKQTKVVDYVIMDTIELPNTKTDAPFKYIQNLLQIHNIILVDTKEILGTNFICLIRFKVKFNQECKGQPIMICVTLFWQNNTFFIKVYDMNQENLEMEKISANWQWEVIKIFTGVTGNKLLENAEKIGKEVYEQTKSFCCLLRSIKFTRHP